MLSPLRRSDPDYFQFDWLPVVAAARRGAWSYAVNDIVRPLRSNGFYAVCTRAGLTAQREPVWGASDGVEVADGSAIWTMRAPSGVTLPTISAVTYTLTPTGITQNSASISGNTSTVKFDGSSAGLGVYEILAEATIGGEDYSLEEAIEVIE